MDEIKTIKGSVSDNEGRYSDLSQARRDQLATIHRDNITTSSTVPGQIVIRVLRTKRVLKLIRLSAPILRDDASVNSRLCSNITLENTRLTSYSLDWSEMHGLFSPASRCLPSTSCTNFTKFSEYVNCGRGSVL